MQRVKIEYYEKSGYIKGMLLEFPKRVTKKSIKRLLKTFIETNKHIIPFDNFKYYKNDDSFFKECEISDRKKVYGAEYLYF